ncbi:hypothetical protein DCAR_0205729 [Daucus carota subsp. sativus]|uniref:Uncharacterized protein n=1 Tax=Daucus carota subsp. sativus TaxID=79200 RepID=A0A175YBZ8_DAUCS|nr:hypothetical protein DCAR_0205729 [Daucus carota subsp. sativus]
MDTTPLNTEFDQGRIQFENETATTLVTLLSATLPIKVFVTTSVAVSDSISTAAPLAVDYIPAVRVPLAVKITPAVIWITVVYTQIDSIVSSKPAVTQMQSPYSDVLLEDDSDYDNVLISSFIQDTSKPSTFMHISTAHTNVSRVSEGEKKKREITELRVSVQNERQPNVLAKGEGLEHVQSEHEGATNLKALGLENSTVRTSLRLSSLEEKVAVMNENLNSLSQSFADGFSKIPVALDSFSELLHVANLPKGEKSNRSDKRELDDEPDKGDQPYGDSFQPPDQPSKESQGNTSQKEIGGASETGKREHEASAQGEQGEHEASTQREYGEATHGELNTVEIEINGERVLANISLAEDMNRSEAVRRNASVSRTILPPLRTWEPTSGSSALERSFRQREEEIAKGKGKGKLVEYADEPHTYTDDEQFEKVIHDAKAGSENRLMNWSAENSDKFGTVNLDKTNRSQDRHVKKRINLANAVRKEKGGSLIYLAFDEDIQEAVVVGQEAGERGRVNESETEATINTSVTEATVNEPEVTVRKTVVSRTEDAVMETTVNEAAVITGETENCEADPMEATLAGTESTVMPCAFNEAILKEIEDIVISTARYAQMRRREAFKYFLEKRAARWTSRMWSGTKHPANDHFKRLHNKTEVTPIQKAQENIFDVMKRLLLARVFDIGVNYDEKGNVISYMLFHPIFQGHVSQTVFDTEFKNYREADTRSIYFFELERMIEFLMDDPSVSMKTMEPILNYHTLRKREFDERYGNWIMHDDSDYLFPEEEEEDQIDELPNDVIDLTADDEVKQPQQTSQGNPSTTQQHQYTPPSYQEQREEVINLYRVQNRDHSMRPYYISRILDKPIRYKNSDQEIHINSLKKLKTIIVKEMYIRVVGSLNNLEAQFAEECEVVLESRENEDPKLDEKRRETLYSVPGRKFRINFNWNTYNIKRKVKMSKEKHQDKSCINIPEKVSTLALCPAANTTSKFLNSGNTHQTIRVF